MPKPKPEQGDRMKPDRWWYTTAPALIGIFAGLVITADTEDHVAIGGAILAIAMLSLSLTLIRRWITDTQNERHELRTAIRAENEAREAAQLAHAMTSAERERARSQVADAEARARQAEINADQRARAAERRKEVETARCIGEEVARLRKEAEECWARVKADSYKEGVLAALSGQIDKIVLDAPDADVIDLDEHRASAPRAAGDHR